MRGAVAFSVDESAPEHDESGVDVDGSADAGRGEDDLCYAADRDAIICGTTRRSTSVFRRVHTNCMRVNGTRSHATSTKCEAWKPVPASARPYPTK